MYNTNRNLLFFAKRSKPNADGQIPVFSRISVDGKQLEFSLNLSLPPQLWDGKKGRATGSTMVAKHINEQLMGIESTFFTYTKEQRESGRAVNIKDARDRILGKETAQLTLIGLFEQHNRDMRERTGIDYARLTIQRYEAALTHIRAFLLKLYKVKDLSLNEIDHQFLTRFEHYLKVTANCQHNTAMKHIKSLKKIIGIALANEQMRKNPFIKFRITIKEVEKEFLTEHELKQLNETQFKMPRIAVVKDLFLFQCYTGLAYTDLKDLTTENVKLHRGGELWVMTQRTKTGIPCNIPLLPTAKAVVEKYADHPCRQKGLLFPVPSNQKMNAYLKEIGDLCGIAKDLTTHMARHTFATTVTLSNGISIETVSKMLGHRKLQTTQIYAKVLDDKIFQEMSTLTQRFT